MQNVSTELLTALRSNNSTAKNLAMVVEFYHQDAVPGASGFDPSSVDLLLAVSKVEGITFKGVAYQKLITKNGIGTIRRTIRKELSSFSVTLSNSSRELIDFEYDYGFEGKICVVRLIDRVISTDLDDSIVLFTGRCEKIQNFNKSSESARVDAKQILNQTEIKIPRRKFTVDDIDGRLPSDPLFEGFRFTQRPGSVTYIEKVKKKFLFFFSYTKKVRRTVQYSSHSDLDQEAVVPLALGRVQMELKNFAYEDKGTAIDVLAMGPDGYENGIADFVDPRSVTDGLPISVLAERYGLDGNTGTQVIRDAAFVGAGYYSKTAYIEASATGTLVENDDPAPQIVAIVLGLKVPVYDDAGDFVDTGWTDNPIVIARWALQSSYVFGLDTEWLDDTEALTSALYCNQVLTDTSNSDTVLYNSSLSALAGTNFRNYRGSGALTPIYYKWYSGTDTSYDAWLREVEYQFYDDTPYNSDDWTGGGTPSLPSATYRRRYTCNVLLSEQASALDFLFDVILPTCNGYLVQKANGKIAIRVAKPANHSFVYSASAALDDEINVRSILPWTTGERVLVGATLGTSEVRAITGKRYNTSVTINISVTGCSVSSSTLTGGSTTVAPHATITVSSTTGNKVITIDGYQVTYVPTGDDTTVTCAAFIAAMVKSHPILNRYIEATWNANESTVLIESKIGVLELDAALENAHLAALSDPTTAPTLASVSSGSLGAGTYKVAYSYETAEGETLTSNEASITLTANKNISVSAITPPARATSVKWYVSLEANGVRKRLHTTNDGSGFTISSLPDNYDPVEPSYNSTAEEIHVVAMAFTDRAESQSQLASSNMLKGTFQFPMGNRQASTNEILIKYRDASQDFKATELRVRDKENIAKVKKINTKEINGAGIDSYHQARRIANQKLAEWRDGDFFHGFSSSGEALLLEEGDVVCVTEESGRFVNESIRVEDIEINDNDGYAAIKIIGRKYRRYYYDDQIEEKIVPLPIVVNSGPNLEQTAPTIIQTPSTTPTNTTADITVTGHTPYARYRKIEVSANSDMSSATEYIRTFENNAGVLPQADIANKEVTTNAETRYIRVSHSSNGSAYGEPSNIISILFANSGGTGGGSGDEPPVLSAGWDSGTEQTSLTWTAGDGSGNYTVERNVLGSGWTVLTSSESGTSYTTTDSKTGFRYVVAYRVRRSSPSTSPYSNIEAIEVFGDPGI